jgi:hypothetical protein
MNKIFLLLSFIIASGYIVAMPPKKGEKDGISFAIFLFGASTVAAAKGLNLKTLEGKFKFALMRLNPDFVNLDDPEINKTVSAKDKSNIVRKICTAAKKQNEANPRFDGASFEEILTELKK